MLFGSVYSRFCRTLRPGKVIALVRPRLMPRKNGDHSSTLAFSINDDVQLRVVADARDYGVCKGTIRGQRRPDGQWDAATVKRCTRYVDTSDCDYCPSHRKQGLAPAPTNGLQNLRNEATLFQRTRGHPPLEAHQKLHSSAPLLRPEPGLTAATSRSEQMMLQFQRQQVGPGTQRTNLETCIPGSSFLANSSKVANLQPGLREAGSGTLGLPSTAAGRRGGITVTPESVAAFRSANHATQPSLSGSSRCSDPLGRRLESHVNGPTNSGGCGRLGQNALKRRLQAVNTDVAGFDGSVPVPKAAKIFQQQGCGQLPHSRAVAAPVSLEANRRAKEQKVVESQRQLASLLLSQKQGPIASVTNENSSNQVSSIKKSTATETNGPVGATSLAQVFNVPVLDKQSQTQILEAQSHFALEAQADEYARSRRVVVQLEERENRQGSVPNRNGAAKVEKEWTCVTCHGVFRTCPKQCYHLNHTVHIKRSLVDQKLSVSERRLQQSSNDAHLKLGSGLEWSSFSNRFR
jgi:hypothetical protein